VKLTTHLHLMQRLGMRGAILPLPQHIFTAWCLIKPRDTSSWGDAKLNTGKNYLCFHLSKSRGLRKVVKEMTAITISAL
jgi:hypothetical protein